MLLCVELHGELSHSWGRYGVFVFLVVPYKNNIPSFQYIIILFSYEFRSRIVPHILVFMCTVVFQKFSDNVLAHTRPMKVLCDCFLRCFSIQLSDKVVERIPIMCALRWRKHGGFGATTAKIYADFFR